MKLNPPPKIRAAIYILTALGTPIVFYLKAKGIIGDLELNLWGAEMTAVGLMAGFNVTLKEN